MENGKGAIAANLVNGYGFGSTEFHVIRAKDPKDQLFLFFLLMNKAFRSTARRFMRGSAGQLRVPIDFLEEYPLYSLPEPSTREELGAKILEIVQKIQGQRATFEKAKLVKKRLLERLLGE
jgi:type I restriction enzyme S subunit